MDLGDNDSKSHRFWAIVIKVIILLSGAFPVISSYEEIPENVNNGKIPIYVGGFFPIGGHPAFNSLPGTVQTAIDHINSLQGILDDYELRMRWNWTNVSIGYNVLGVN